MSKTMNALLLSTPTTPTTPPTLTLTTRPIPTPPPSHLLVRISASAIHPSDLLNATGKFPYTTYPRIPGRDFAGTIASLPANSTSPLPIGAKVYGTSGFTQAFSVDGGHAEYIVVPENAVAAMPANLSYVQAASVGVPYTTASLIITRAAMKKGETVLVLGASGAVGRAAVQLARREGCKVITATRDGSGDISTASDPGLESVAGLSGGKGVDVVVDTVGVPALTRAGVECLGRGGRLAMIAAPRSGSTDLGIDMLGFYRKEKSLVGVNSLLYGVEELAVVLGELRGGFEDGSLDVGAEGEFRKIKLVDGVSAYEKAREKGAGKVVIVMD